MATIASAQTFLYTHNRIHTGQDANSNNTFTYRSIVSSANMVTLHNTANTRVNVNPTFRDGSPLTERIMRGQEQLIERDSWTQNRAQSVINNAFTHAERQRLSQRDALLTTSMIIDTTTGRVVEVEFRFLTNSEFATFPVSVFRHIELELKRLLYFTPTETGRQLNFVRRTWTQTPV